VERAERKYADRHGDGAVQKLNKRLFDMALADDGHDVPAWADALPNVGSEQAVTIFRPITMAETVHPDAREFFDPSELSEVIEKAPSAASARRDSIARAGRRTRACGRSCVSSPMSASASATAGCSSFCASKANHRASIGSTGSIGRKALPCANDALDAVLYPD
jgi:hypothetical protein